MIFTTFPKVEVELNFARQYFGCFSEITRLQNSRLANFLDLISKKLFRISKGQSHIYKLDST